MLAYMKQTIFFRFDKGTDPKWAHPPPFSWKNGRGKPADLPNLPANVNISLGLFHLKIHGGGGGGGGGGVERPQFQTPPQWFFFWGGGGEGGWNAHNFRPPPQWFFFHVKPPHPRNDFFHVNPPPTNDFHYFFKTPYPMCFFKFNPIPMLYFATLILVRTRIVEIILQF